jgi:hypothetical protein
MTMAPANGDVDSSGQATASEPVPTLVKVSYLVSSPATELVKTSEVTKSTASFRYSPEENRVLVQTGQESAEDGSIVESDSPLSQRVRFVLVARGRRELLRTTMSISPSFKHSFLSYLSSFANEPRSNQQLVVTTPTRADTIMAPCLPFERCVRLR